VTLKAPDGLFVGTNNISGSIQNRHVSVSDAISYQVARSYGKRVDKRLLTLAIYVAVQLFGEGICVRQFRRETDHT
jgi:hypothetical protein